MTTKRWNDTDVRMVGHAVSVARRNGVPWKVLVGLYRRSRVQLWRLARAYETSFRPYETSAPLQNARPAESLAAV